MSREEAQRRVAMQRGPPAHNIAMHVILLLLVLYVCCAGFRGIINGTVVVVMLLVLGVVVAHGQTLHGHAGVTCQDDGRYTHCWDSRTGNAVSTTEHGEGGTSHTWDANGYRLTTWEH